MIAHVVEQGTRVRRGREHADEAGARDGEGGADAGLAGLGEEDEAGGGLRGVELRAGVREEGEVGGERRGGRAGEEDGGEVGRGVWRSGCVGL